MSNNIQAKRCEFASACKYYQKDSYTCNNDNEANGYCGFNSMFRSK